MNSNFAALNFLTQCLSNNLNEKQSKQLRQQIHTQNVPWELVIELANIHLLTPALWVALTRRQLDKIIPEDIQDYLVELHQMSVNRNEHLRVQLLEAVEKLNSVGITPVLMKGAKYLINDIYGDLGSRIMSDIDLLVSEDEIERSMKSLLELGYKPDEDVHNDYHNKHHHCPPLFRPGDYGTLEIHRYVTQQPFEKILPTSIALDNAVPLTHPTLNMKIFSPTHRTLHNILHNFLVDLACANGMFPLRSMHELLTEYEDKNEKKIIDWTYIAAQMKNHQRTRALDAYIYVANKLFGISVPTKTRSPFGARIFYQRCCCQLKWQWMNTWGMRYGRYSIDNVRRLESTEYEPSSVFKMRLSRLSRKINAVIRGSL